MKTLIYLQVTALCLTAALSSALAGEKELPFHGTMQALELQAVQFPTLNVDGTGAGKGTRLGKFTLTYEATVNLLTGAGAGSLEFIAANGDSVFADFVGRSTPTGTPNEVSIVETATITGGTGRFTGATGRFLITRTLDRSTGLNAGAFDGTIIIHKGD